MSKKNKNKNKNRGDNRADGGPKLNLHPETARGIWAVALFTAALVLILSWFGQAGGFGKIIYDFFHFLLGGGFFLVPLALVLAGAGILRSIERHFYFSTFFGSAILVLSGLAIMELFSSVPRSAGYVGFFALYPFEKLLGFWASLVVLASAALISLLIIFNLPLKRTAQEKENKKETPEEGRMEIVSLREMSHRDKIKREGGLVAFIKRIIFGKEEIKVNMPASAPVEASLAEEQKEEKESEAKKSAAKKLRIPSPEYPLLAAACQIETVYQFPSLDLLEGDRGLPSSGDIKANANIIKRTLQNFGIEVEMAEVNVGPTVTQYTLKPAEGVKLSRIMGLQNDLALALAAKSVRIEAPIPGRALVGIEVPNKAISVVGLKSLLSDSQFTESPSFLAFALGRDVAGHSIFADLAKMPHLLIAGATGSGKSVAIHSLIISLVYRNSPETLKFIMIDPKRVELNVYNNIPHLLAPVVVEGKKALGALRWAVKEMERRYEILSEEGSRDISSFNAKIIKKKTKDNELEIMPYVVIVIDELADLMAATFRREVEASIVRLAQMARAVGIHLVVSTQRPSVEVLTGLIKANITSRVALQVASQVDSRTILDMAGAEKLLGNGDMLFLAGDAGKPRRIQGTYISEKEGGRVIEFLGKTAAENAKEEKDIFAAAPESANILNFNENDVDDELYEEAKKIVIEAGKASASFLQRRLRIGYARAARILDIMEEQGIIGPADGAKPRDILVERSKDLPNDDVVEDGEEENF